MNSPEFETDHDALTLLEKRGYLIHRGIGVILRHRKPSEDEERAIKFLCEDYDYCWEAAEKS